MKETSPFESYVQLGRALRARRLLQGANQRQLARALGVTFQQVQRYEVATSKITVAKLTQAAAYLGCSAADLIDEAAGASSGVLREELQLLATPRGNELARTFVALEPRLQIALLELARSMASAAGDPKNQLTDEFINNSPSGFATIAGGGQ